MIPGEAYKTLTVTVSLIDSAENNNVFIRSERASIVSKIKNLINKVRLHNIHLWLQGCRKRSNSYFCSAGGP